MVKYGCMSEKSFGQKFKEADRAFNFAFIVGTALAGIAWLHLLAVEKTIGTELGISIVENTKALWRQMSGKDKLQGQPMGA